MQTDPLHSDPMVIDCDRCSARPAACADCVVTLLLASPATAPGALTLDGADHDALHVLAEAGLAPRLRHVPVLRVPVLQVPVLQVPVRQVPVRRAG